MRRFPGFILCTLLLFACPGLAQNELSHPIDFSTSLQGITLVVLDLDQANILFTNPTSGKIVIRGTITSDIPNPRFHDCSLQTRIQEKVLTVEPLIPTGREVRGLRRHLSYDIEVQLPRNLDIRFEISKGSITLTGPFEKKFILKMRHGQIHYRIGPSPPHDLEAKAVFGTVRSEMEDILPRPYFPLGKRIFVLTPEGKGEVYLRTTFGTITLGH